MNWKIDSLKARPHFLFAGLLFLLLSLYLLLNQSLLYFAFSAFICLIALGYFLSLSNLKTSYFALAFLLPLSIKLKLNSVGFDLTFPSEALIALIAIALVFRWLLKGYHPKEFLFSRFSLLILTYLLLSAIAAVFSTMPFVSLKAVLVRITYVLVFYFGIGDVFYEDSGKTSTLFLKYGYSLIFVTIYCLYFQSMYNWDKQTAAYSVNPFYSDHTIFSACLAFILPAFLSHSFNTSASNNLVFTKISGWIYVLIFFLGIYFSFCRAAWISLFFAFLLSISVAFGFKPRHYLLILLAIISMTLINKDELFYSFKENKNISTAPNTTAIVQTQSITNVSTDVSNAERLNRWSCAWRMFMDKPFTGFGPGTFQFQYLPYQLPDEITYISVFSPYTTEQGRGGSTHNEYLLLLSECGILAFLCFVFLLITLLYSTLTSLAKKNSTQSRQAILWALVGLFTYLVHGFFNNFLDTDKAAFLFWTSISTIVSWNLIQKKTASKN